MLRTLIRIVPLALTGYRMWQRRQRGQAGRGQTQPGQGPTV